MAVIDAYAGLPFGMVSTTSSGAQWIPVTSWGPAAGIASLRSRMEMRGRFGLLLAAPAYQTCGSDSTTPDGAVIIPIENDATGGYADADGVWELNTTVTSPTVANRNQIRFGWLIKTSGAIGGACVGGIIEVIR